MLLSFSFGVALALGIGFNHQSSCYEDVVSALEQIDNSCGTLLKSKGISIKKLQQKFLKESKKVKTEQQEYVLLQHLIARLEDGHAQVRLTEKTQGLTWPHDGSLFDPSIARGDSGLAVCRVGKKFYVKAVAGPAKDANLRPGSEILKIDGEKPASWFSARIEKGRELISWSTEQQAFFWATHWGLSAPVGSRLKLEVKQPDGKKKKRTLSIGKSHFRMAGPAVWPESLQGEKDLRYGLLESGFAYLYVRRCKENLAQQVDEALATLGNVPGLILDFRGNSGGGFNHDELLGRFIPKGKTLSFTKSFPSTGPVPYGGPIVVLVDGTVVSAGETASGMFKEEGRAYMIGESPTAGMSSSKQVLELPSGKFQLYVSLRSNKSRWQKGRGIEGFGIQPHEILAFNPKDLASGVDTLIQAAVARLQEGLSKEVPYKPEKFGWKVLSE